RKAARLSRHPHAARAAASVIRRLDANRSPRPSGDGQHQGGRQMSSVRTFVAMAAAVAGLATHAAAQQQCGPCGSDWVAYEMQDKVQLNTPITVTSPFTTGSVLMTKTHRLLVPAGLNGSGPASPEPHYLGVELLPGTYDVTTTPPLKFTTAIGSVTFKPGQLKFFYDPSSKSL